MEGSSRPRQPTILTPDQRLRVFVSSTLKELEPERAAVRDAIENLRLAPVMFELGARPHAARDVYRAYLDQSHIFIGIYGDEYGWVAPGMPYSGLEDEYRLARDKPKLVYIRAQASRRDPRLREMLTSIRDHDRVSYKYFSSADELRDLVTNDLALVLVESFESFRGLAPPTTVARRDDLPVPLTPLIGREREAASAGRLLTDDAVRLLTLTGPGGSGKTRLGLEVARALLEQFDEVHVVELAPINDPTLVLDAIARRVGLSEAGTRPLEMRLEDYLRDRRALLVLDNFEQVTAAAPAVARLLEGCPALKILVTSRTPLQVRGETEIPVPPLPVPDAEERGDAALLSRNEAVRLFVDRAKAIKPDFAVTEENAPVLAEICRRLDGLPLAIELAAARVRLLPPLKILERLEHRLAFLHSGSRDLPERQRTMRNAIAWSYDLLDDDEATLFRRLSVFAGGCTLEAVEAVCNHDDDVAVDVLDALEALASQNLIRPRGGEGDELRFDMLETIRDYALERLSATEEFAAIMAQHASYLVEFAERAEPHLTSGRRDPWIVRLQAEIDDIRVVLRRSLQRRIDPSYGIRLAGTLGWFWHLRGHLSEGRTWASSLAKLPEAEERTRARAKLLFPAGGLAWSQGDYATANAYLEESAAIFDRVGDLKGLTDARGILSGGLASLGEHDRALALCEDTAARLRAAGDRWGLAFTLTWLGSIVLVKTGDAGAAREVFEQSLSLAEQLDDPWIHAEALHHLGDAAGLQGDYQAARANFEESLAHHEVIGDQWAIARGLSGFAEATLRHGDFDGADDLFKRGLTLWREIGHALGSQACLGGLAQVAAGLGKTERAARLYGATPELVRTIGYLFLRAAPPEYRQLQAQTRDKLEADVWRAEYAEGRALTLDEAVGFALA